MTLNARTKKAISSLKPKQLKQRKEEVNKMLGEIDKEFHSQVPRSQITEKPLYQVINEDTEISKLRLQKDHIDTLIMKRENEIRSMCNIDKLQIMYNRAKDWDTVIYEQLKLERDYIRDVMRGD